MNNPTQQVHVNSVAVQSNPTKSPKKKAPSTQTGLYPEGSSEWKALQVTGEFEGGTQEFSTVSGNHDGQGLSFGVLQWNFGKQSLQPLLQKMSTQYESVFNQAFGELAQQVKNVLKAKPSEQVKWGNSITNKRDPHRLLPTWQSKFEALGKTPQCTALQLEKVNVEMNRAKKYAKEFGLKTEKGLALMFDICTQNNFSLSEKEVRAYVKQHPGVTELQKMEYIANTVAGHAYARYQQLVLQRKMAIAHGKGPVAGYGGPHGKPKHFDFEKKFGLSNASWEANSGKGRQVPATSTTGTGTNARPTPQAPAQGAGVPNYPIKRNLLQGIPKIPYRKGVGNYEGVVCHCTDSNDTQERHTNR